MDGSFEIDFTEYLKMSLFEALTRTSKQVGTDSVYGSLVTGGAVTLIVSATTCD